MSILRSWISLFSKRKSAIFERLLCGRHFTLFITVGRGSVIIPFGEIKKQAQKCQAVWFRAAPSSVCLPVPVDEAACPWAMRDKYRNQE